ncbi:MAG: peptidoglycan editing factor PgeF [Anaerolineaceae bacterium]|nr:peptidoglycan editing factor PgeF [Anaerolineaceae bacterium]
MPFRDAGLLKYHVFSSFDREELVQGTFSRHGGVSPTPWASLNLGGTVGDEREHVVENRRRIFELFARPVESIYDPWQAHGTEVVCVERPRPLDSLHQKADVILTNRADVTLFMRFADCVPIVLYDPFQRVIGLVHAGWRGTVAGIAETAVKSMAAHYGCSPRNILAGIGPSICVDHYQVGEEVITAAQGSYGADASKVLWKKNGAYHFDLWTANAIVLEKSGVQTIEQAGICTYCDNADWYSHRAEKGKTGRFGAILGLKDIGVGNDTVGSCHTEEYPAS